MPRIIALLNHKGGVGKTTSAVNIAAGMSAEGRTVLLVDLDPQSNASHSLGAYYEGEDTIYGALLSGEVKAIAAIAGGIDLIPSTLDLSGAELELAGEPGREFLLRDILRAKRFLHYDHIIIDCPPSLGLLTLNALVAADAVYIPVQAHYLAAQGLTKILNIVEKVRRRLNKGLKVGGIFITHYDRRKVLNREVAEAIKEQYPELAMNAKIRENIALAEAPARELDIFRYAPKSTGAVDYRSLVQDILLAGSNYFNTAAEARKQKKK